ncbi:hypothetical protein U27_06562 [Candidatus Vecturithrix granuli]|uniref:Uncharacterized protein n=1 Tax=Vecturithrix granuli TaxID=1499967 RepID=A0A081C4S2_VECG1|nr:hypothetical protein U27_06562 [Candidatus Vecturithrix granuli]
MFVKTNLLREGYSTSSPRTFLVVACVRCSTYRHRRPIPLPGGRVVKVSKTMMEFTFKVVSI